MAKSTIIENFDNAVYKSAGGNDTKDKVFLFSQLEMIDSDFGFSEDYGDLDVNRRCSIAWYKGKNCDDSLRATADGEPGFAWWLRTPGVGEPGEITGCACLVGLYGEVNYDGDRMGGVESYIYYGAFVGVRPALYISLK